MEQSQELCLLSFGGVVQKPLCTMLHIENYILLWLLLLFVCVKSG